MLYFRSQLLDIQMKLNHPSSKKQEKEVKT